MTHFKFSKTFPAFSAKMEEGINVSAGVPMLDQLVELARAAADAYPLLSRLGEKEDCLYECPHCDGEGYVDSTEYLARTPAGIQIYGNGEELTNLENYVNALNPTTVIRLIEQLKAAEAFIDSIRSGLHLEQFCKDRLAVYDRFIAE